VGVAVVIATGPGLSLATSVTGDVLTLAAALCWSTYTAFGSAVLRRYSPIRTTAWAMVGGTIVLAVPGSFQAAGADWSGVTAGAWAGLLYSALIAAGLSNVLVFTAIKLLGPTPVTALQSLVPFLAVLLGAEFLGEPIRPEQIVGGAIIVAGVMITRAGSSLALRRKELIPLE
jgi:drug/metabolite transporter (DMT)-like permease